MTIYPNAQTRVVAKKCMELLNTLQQTGTTAGMENEMLSHRELWSMFNSEKWVAIEKKVYAGLNDMPERKHLIIEKKAQY